MIRRSSATVTPLDIHISISLLGFSFEIAQTQENRESFDNVVANEKEL